MSRGYLSSCLIHRGTAISFEQAIAGRVITGFGGAGMIALASLIITGKFAMRFTLMLPSANCDRLSLQMFRLLAR